MQEVEAAYTQGPAPALVDPAPALRSVGMLRPADAVDYEHDTASWFQGGGTRFVDDVLGGILGDVLSDGFGDVGSAPGGVNSMRRSATQVGGGRGEPSEADRVARAEEKALLGARHGNVDAVAEALEEHADIDTADGNGNTLLILAAQSGNKRMVKFLLRRGAFISAQNHGGNTAGHYAYEYGKPGLGDYLVQKGLDDMLLNAAGLTMYEGTRRDALENL